MGTMRYTLMNPCEAPSGFVESPLRETKENRLYVGDYLALGYKQALGMGLIELKLVEDFEAENVCQSIGFPFPYV